MTPRQKAQELFFSMLNNGRGITTDTLAIECAITAVDEMIDELSCMEQVCNIPESYVKYWKKVKKELKKLGNYK